MFTVNEKKEARYCQLTTTGFNFHILYLEYKINPSFGSSFFKVKRLHFTPKYTICIPNNVIIESNRNDVVENNVLPKSIFFEEDARVYETHLNLVWIRLQKHNPHFRLLYA